MINFLVQCCKSVYGRKRSWWHIFELSRICIYEGVKTRVRTLGGDIKDFPIDIGLHQG